MFHKQSHSKKLQGMFLYANSLFNVTKLFWYFVACKDKKQNNSNKNNNNTDTTITTTTTTTTTNNINNNK